MISKSADWPVHAVINRVGGRRRLADILGITATSVAGWINRGYVPASRVLELERLTGISRYDLRPDLYGEKSNEEI